MDGKEIQIINVTLIYIYGSLLRFNKISIRLCDVDTKDTHNKNQTQQMPGAKVQGNECDNNVEKGCRNRGALTMVCLCSKYDIRWYTCISYVGQNEKKQQYTNENVFSTTDIEQKKCSHWTG